MKKRRLFAIVFALIAITQLAVCQNHSNKTNNKKRKK